MLPLREARARKRLLNDGTQKERKLLKEYTTDPDVAFPATKIYNAQQLAKMDGKSKRKKAEKAEGAAEMTIKSTGTSEQRRQLSIGLPARRITREASMLILVFKGLTDKECMLTRQLQKEYTADPDVAFPATKIYGERARAKRKAAKPKKKK